MVDCASTSPEGRALPISCYIRTLNEARLIGDVVAVAKSLCDQVVVVDSGSTDDTVNIARAAGAEIIHQAWLGNGHQKKVGELACRHDWLLDLDADEVLSPELMCEIRREFSHNGPAGDVYQLPLTIVDPGGRVWFGMGMSLRSKLYNRRRVEMPAEYSWDQLSPPPGLRIKRFYGPLLHHGIVDIGHLVRKQQATVRSRVKGTPARNTWLTRLRVIGAMPFYFLKSYIVRGLWRGGVYGLSIALACAFTRWCRDVRMYERDCLKLEADRATTRTAISSRDNASISRAA